MLRKTLLLFIFTALVADCLYLTITGSDRELEVRRLYTLLTRYQTTNNAQEGALHSCRAMVDDYVDTRRNNLLYTMTIVSTLKPKPPKWRRTLVARTPYLQPDWRHGILQEAN